MWTASSARGTGRRASLDSSLSGRRHCGGPEATLGVFMAAQLPDRDLPLVLYELLEEIARLKADQAAPAEVELLAAEFRRLQAEL